MKTLEFSTIIKAPLQLVWKHLWDPESYKVWTSQFSAGSYYETKGWKAGNRIHFLLPNGEGMYSNIEEIQAPRLMVFRHIGNLTNFVEQPVNETQSWHNAMERYELWEHPEGTELLVTADTADEYIDFMNKTFPKALESLKKISVTP